MSVLLFAGESYYPGGGWHDFVGEFPTVAAAKAHIDDQVHVEHHPAWTEHVPAREPGARVLYASTNSTLTPPRTDAHDVHHPAHVEVRAPFDWAHIVEVGDVVASWHGGYYGHPVPQWTDEA